MYPWFLCHIAITLTFLGVGSSLQVYVTMDKGRGATEFSRIRRSKRSPKIISVSVRMTLSLIQVTKLSVASQAYAFKFNRALL